MPRTFFGRSWLVRASFAGTDLSGCDLRASIFRRCSFAGAVAEGTGSRARLRELLG